MLSAYPACFFKEESGYSVVFPDLNDLSTCGETLDESLRMAVDCLAGYLYWLKKDGEAAPAPSSVDAEEYAKTHFEKAVKKTLTIPAWLNTAALEQNINFSQVLQDALKAQLHMG